MAKLDIAGCDYLRMSLPTERPWADWQAIFLAEALAEQQAGRKWTSRWLYGYYGPMLEHMFGGVGAQGTLLQFSGEAADRYFMKAYSGGGHVSRVDWQVTMPMGPKQWEYIEAAYHESEGKPKTRGKNVEPQMSIRPSGARMVTFGSRTSEVYGRIYDKERESGKEVYAGCIRWEVEYHNKRAGDICDYLSRREHYRSDSALVVREQFAQWGVTRQWDERVAFEAPPVAARGRTFESREAWIATQVSKTLRYLVENGREKEAAAALLTAFDRISVDDNRMQQLSKLLRLCILEGV